MSVDDVTFLHALQRVRPCRISANVHLFRTQETFPTTWHVCPVSAASRRTSSTVEVVHQSFAYQVLKPPVLIYWSDDQNIPRKVSGMQYSLSVMTGTSNAPSCSFSYMNGILSGTISRQSRSVQTLIRMQPAGLRSESICQYRVRFLTRTKVKVRATSTVLSFRTRKQSCPLNCSWHRMKVNWTSNAWYWNYFSRPTTLETKDRKKNTL